MSLALPLHWGEVVAKKLGRYVTPWLSKIGPPELIFWLETRASGTIFLLKFVPQKLKLTKIGLEMQDLFKNSKWVSGTGKRLEKVGLRS